MVPEPSARFGLEYQSNNKAVYSAVSNMEN